MGPADKRDGSQDLSRQSRAVVRKLTRSSCVDRLIETEAVTGAAWRRFIFCTLLLSKVSSVDATDLSMYSLPLPVKREASVRTEVKEGRAGAVSWLAFGPAE